MQCVIPRGFPTDHFLHQADIPVIEYSHFAVTLVPSIFIPSAFNLNTISSVNFILSTFNHGGTCRETLLHFIFKNRFL